MKIKETELKPYDTYILRCAEVYVATAYKGMNISEGQARQVKISFIAGFAKAAITMSFRVSELGEEEGVEVLQALHESILPTIDKLQINNTETDIQE